MILPINEISDNPLHPYFKTEAGLSLKYQLKKMIFICKQVETLLEKQQKSQYHYFTSDEPQYTINALINNYSQLIEYYFSWIIFVHIGTIKHIKVEYKAIENDEIKIKEAI